MPQLCESCDIEVFKKCKWAHSFKPIEGWEVKRSADTYEIIQCPDYRKERKRKKMSGLMAEAVKIKYYCVICGKELDGKGRKFCSQECRKIYWREKNKEKYARTRAKKAGI